MPDEKEKKILNQLLMGAGITTVGLFLSKIITYGYRAIIGRALGPEAYGILNTAIMIVSISATFAGGPVKNGLKKFIPEYRENNDLASIKGTVLSALQINLIGSIIVSITLFLSAEFIGTTLFDNSTLVPVIRLFSFVLLIGRPYDILIDTTVGFNKAKYKVISTNIVQNILQLGITVLLVIGFGMGVIGAVWGWILAVFFTLPLAFYYVEKKVGPVLTADVKPNYNVKELFNYSYPLMMSGMVKTFLGWTDTAFIGYLMNQASVGLYNAAYPTAMIISVPADALGTLALPSFSEQQAKNMDKKESLRTLTRWGFALSFPAFLIMALYSKQLLKLLFGNQYTGAGTVLTILAFGTMFSTGFGKISDIMKSAGKTKILFYNTLINVFINIGLNAVLIPIYGLIGAAVATSTSTIVMSSILAIEVWRYENIHPFSRNMIKTVFSGLAAISITYVVFNTLFSPAPLWIMIPGGIIFLTLYTIIFAKIGGIKEYDREIIITTARKVGLENKTRKVLQIIT